MPHETSRHRWLTRFVWLGVGHVPGRSNHHHRPIPYCRLGLRACQEGTVNPFTLTPVRPLQPAHWTEQALCARPENRPTAGDDPWFPTTKGDRAYAEKICADCPVQKECAELGADQPWGIWGGGEKQEPENPITPCATCDHPTRPGKARAAEYPGTLSRNSKGICSRCYGRQKYGYQPNRPRFEPGTPCIDCDRPLRPAKTSITQYPGTYLNRGYGRCQTCYDHAKRDK